MKLRLGNVTPHFRKTASRGRPEGYRDSLLMLDECISHASHWTLTDPVKNMLDHTDIKTEELEGMRLPFDVMAIEWLQKSDGSGSFLLLFELTIDGVEGFMVVYVMHDEHHREFHGEWTVLPTSMFIPYKALSDAGKWLRSNEKGWRIEISNNAQEGECPSVIPAIPYYNAKYGTLSKETKDHFIVTLSAGVLVILRFLIILSCDNAPVKEIRPSKFQQDRRRRKKLPPLPIYRTLHISDHRTGGNTGGGTKGGTKRAHWRRGHIRNQPTAKGYVRRWIKPMVVGGSTAPKPDIVVT